MGRLYKFEAGRPVAALKRHTSLLVIFHTGEFCSKCFCQVCDFFREEIGVVPFPTILEENNVEEMSERARRKVRLGLFTSVTFQNFLPLTVTQGRGLSCFLSNVQISDCFVLCAYTVVPTFFTVLCALTVCDWFAISIYFTLVRMLVMYGNLHTQPKFIVFPSRQPTTYQCLKMDEKRCVQTFMHCFYSFHFANEVLVKSQLRFDTN